MWLIHFWGIVYLARNGLAYTVDGDDVSVLAPSPSIPGSQLAQPGPGVKSSMSMFCSPDFTDRTPQECRDAPEQCVALYGSLQLEVNHENDLPFQNCFTGNNKDKGDKYSCFGLFNGSELPSVYKMFPSVSTFFSDSAKLYQKADFLKDTSTLCVLNANVTEAYDSIAKPVLTYQMVANMVELASTVDPATIANITMLLAPGIIFSTGTFTIRNVEAGLYVGPSDLTFRLQGESGYEFYVPGIAAPDASDMSTAKKVALFEPGAFVNTAVIKSTGHTSMCTDMHNIPVTQVFRKMGVSDAAAKSVVNPGTWFNVTECLDTLNMCENIAQLETKCTVCNATEIQKAPCALYADTVCESVPTVKPPVKARSKSVDGITAVTTLYVVVILLVVSIVGIMAVVFHHKTKHTKKLSAHGETRALIHPSLI